MSQPYDKDDKRLIVPASRALSSLASRSLVARGMALVEGIDIYACEFYFERGVSHFDLHFVWGSEWGSVTEPELAVADLTRAIELRPDFAEAYYYRGRAYPYAEDLYAEDLAVADFTKAIELKPDLVEAYYYRGQAYSLRSVLVNVGERDLAIADFSKVIELEPEFAEAYLYRGSEYFYKDLDSSITDLTKAIELGLKYGDDDSFAHLLRARAYCGKGEFELAIADFSSNIRSWGHNSLAFYERGNAYRCKGELNRAIADFSTAIELDPKFPRAYYDRGITFEQIGQNARAISDLETYSILDPSTSIRDDVEHTIMELKAK